MKILRAAGVILLLVLHPVLLGQEELGEYIRPAVSSFFMAGGVNEAVWARAGRIEQFRQVEPKVGQPPSEKTRVLICHNCDFIYIGMFCFDRKPEGIRATQLERDARLDPDDRVEIILDTFRSHRTA